MPRRPLPAGASDRGYIFYLFRSANESSILLAVVLVGAIEIPLLHLLVASWNHTVAWVLTAITLLSIVWVVGFVRAGRHRFSRVVGDELHLVDGLYEELTVSRGELSTWKVAANDRAPAAGGANAGTGVRSSTVTKFTISFHRPVTLNRFSGGPEAVETYEFDLGDEEAVEWLKEWLPPERGASIIDEPGVTQLLS